MSRQLYSAGAFPERFVEVDAARLLLIIVRFVHPNDEHSPPPRCAPPHPYIGYFAPEYYLQKLDFLLRYPHYFIYELTELYRLGRIPPEQREAVLAVIRLVLTTNEPELMTQRFRRFWRGAYERLDDVQSWWHARRLVYTRLEPRGEARPWKYYFLTEQGVAVAQRLVEEVPHAQWYNDRIALIHTYFGALSAAQVKELQYRHEEYRAAQLGEYIPDLSPQQIEDNYARVFGEPFKWEVSA